MTLRVWGMNRLDLFFEISARKSSVAAELRGGVVTFIAMAYIIVLNLIIHPFCRVRLILTCSPP